MENQEGDVSKMHYHDWKLVKRTIGYKVYCFLRPHTNGFLVYEFDSNSHDLHEDLHELNCKFRHISPSGSDIFEIPEFIKSNKNYLSTFANLAAPRKDASFAEILEIFNAAC